MIERFSEKHAEEFHPLLEFLSSVPAIETNDSPWGGFGTGLFDDQNWWVKFSIIIEHELAWHLVQEFGHVLNYLSLNDRLPTVFKPVSPAPYLNGGPDEFLSWVIECSDTEFTPELASEWLRNRMSQS